MKKILFLAEDDPLISRMYSRAIKLSGYDLVEVADGQLAINKLKEMNPKPDIVLLDIMMPTKTGFDVLRAMKEDQSLSGIPIIILSNLSGQEDARKGLELGANLFMIKSEYNPKQILEKVEEIISKK
jgi:DNA-binding response OmpR family regulator